jgi:PhnB protein
MASIASAGAARVSRWAAGRGKPERAAGDRCDRGGPREDGIACHDIAYGDGRPLGASSAFRQGRPGRREGRCALDEPPDCSFEAASGRGRIPFLAVEDAARAIEFYKRAFGARERMRMNTPDDEIAHAELEIGGRIVMVADRLPIYPWKPPHELGGMSVGLGLYVEDVDAMVKQAVDAGARVTLPVEDKFYGDRYGRVADPFGHEWQLATHTEHLSPDEIAERGRKAMDGPS